VRNGGEKWRTGLARQDEEQTKREAAIDAHDDDA
jgi:hypothetical protein